jgi:hypothetical protein
MREGDTTLRGSWRIIVIIDLPGFGARTDPGGESLSFNMAPTHSQTTKDSYAPRACARLVRTNHAIALGAVLLLGAVLIARADDFWKRKPSSEWTLAQALKLVQQSPWAHQEVMPVTILQQEASMSIPTGTRHCDPDAIDSSGNCLQKGRVEMPVDASQQPDATPLLTPSWAVLVRWESAAPVMQAFARLQELDAKAAAEYQAHPPRLPADRYVVTVKMVQSGKQTIDPFAEQAEKKTEWKALLKTRRGVLEAKETEYSGAGAGASIHFFFPRVVDGAPLLGSESERVEFILQGAHLTVKSKFTLDPEFLR